MPVNSTAIIPAKQAEVPITLQYTSDQMVTIIDKFTATNTSAASIRYLTVYITEKGGTPGNSSTIMKEYRLRPQQTYTFPELVGHILDDGAFISTAADNGSSVTIRASGRQIT